MRNTYHHHSEERKPLRWFASPLKEDQDEKEKRSPPITRENTQSILGDGVQNADVEAGLPLELECDAQQLRDLPAFQRHAEATNVELFFDLCKYHNLHPTSNTSLITLCSSLCRELDHVHFTQRDQRQRLSSRLHRFLLSAVADVVLELALRCSIHRRLHLRAMRQSSALRCHGRFRCRRPCLGAWKGNELSSEVPDTFVHPHVLAPGTGCSVWCDFVLRAQAQKYHLAFIPRHRLDTCCFDHIRRHNWSTSGEF
jgi:hypothetical protein